MHDHKLPASLGSSATPGTGEAASARGGKLISVDNGGTLTDICVIEGERIWHTKTLTTPYDLSRCLLEGLRKISNSIYGEENLAALLRSTDYIRYATTQGTNALVERKGPRLGLILGTGLTRAALEATSVEARALLADLVGSRVIELGSDAGTAIDRETAAVHAVTTLSAAGAHRLVVACGGCQRNTQESELKRLLLRKFPPHMLGAIPILYSHELVEDDDVRRTWSALFNAFLHPAMERFLYSAEHQLREQHARHPLLIFRNDGHSARVTKTIAMKTYGSGPRGGAEGAKALAEHHGFAHLLSMDVGGTTTDLGEVRLIEGRGTIRSRRRGVIEKIETSFPLCDVLSIGVGGSSIIRVDDGRIQVGPDSVGGTPGPACFGLGGREATITDAVLLAGLLDPAAYFGGELALDVERARGAILERVAKPLGVGAERATHIMERAWVSRIAASLECFTDITAHTTLAAFGGAGPLLVCNIAAAAGLTRVIIPRLAAVFSAFGIGFSDIAHQYAAPLLARDADGLARCDALLLERARRGMAAEGAELVQCRITRTLQFAHAAAEHTLTLSELQLPAALPAAGPLTLTLDVVKPIARAACSGTFTTARQPAVAHGTRRVLHQEQWQEVPLYRLTDQPPGGAAQGPAVLEEDFFTCRIEPDWCFDIGTAGDVLLSRLGSCRTREQP